MNLLEKNKLKYRAFPSFPDDLIKGGIYGTTVGDVIGLPYEMELSPVDFLSKEHREMITGDWSDDTAMTLATLDALKNGYDIKRIACYFLDWGYKGSYSSTGGCFGVGSIVSDSIRRLKKGVSPLKSGFADEYHNGNGSLMRMLPVALYTYGLDYPQIRDITFEVSGITHRHIRSMLSCLAYVLLVHNILSAKDRDWNLSSVVIHTRIDFDNFTDKDSAIMRICRKQKTNPLSEVNLVRYAFTADNYGMSLDKIQRNAYVINSLCIAVWCLFNCVDYVDAISKVVGFGGDTDTNASIVGGLFGIWLGKCFIPSEWRGMIKDSKIIDDIFRAF